MKKLSLKKLKLDATDVLQRNQLKNMVGGFGGGYYACCDNNDLLNCSACTYTGTATHCSAGSSLWGCVVF